MDDLDLVIRGHRLSTSESIYALGKEYYEAMFKKTINIDDILQKRQLENMLSDNNKVLLD